MIEETIRFLEEKTFDVWVIVKQWWIPVNST